MKLYGIGRFITMLEGPEGPYSVYTVVSSFHKTMAMDIKLPYGLVNMHFRLPFASVIRVDPVGKGTRV